MNRNKESENIIDIPAGTSTTKNPYCQVTSTKIVVNDDDVYQFEDNNNKIEKFGLKKSLLMKIAEAAGIHWDLESRLLKSDNNIVIFKSVASFRGLDGSFTPYSYTKEYNIPLEEQQIRKRMLSKAYQLRDSVIEEERDILKNLSPEEWSDSQTKLQVLTIRRNKVAIAEISSKLRLIRNVLNIKSSYTKDELMKGFVVKRVDFKPDLEDPDIKKMFIQIGFSNPLYLNVNKQNDPIDVSEIDTPEN